MDKKMLLHVFLLLFLAFFELLYLFGSLDGTCYAFCMTFYNLPCLVFSAGMFIFGLVSVIAWFPRYAKLLTVSLSTYFGVSFLAFLCWAPGVPLLSFAGLVLVLAAYRHSSGNALSPRESLERFFFGLALSTWVFLAVDSCLGTAIGPVTCFLVLIGAFSIPLRIKYPRYSPVPLLLYFLLSLLVIGFHWLESFGLVVSALALLVFDPKVFRRNLK